MGLARWPARLMFCALLMATTAGGAEEGRQVPDTAPHARVVAAAEVAPLIAAGARLIDVRSVHDFLAGHIAGALHATYREYSARQPDFDPGQDGVAAFLDRLKHFARPDDAIILYCNGVHCWKSYKATAAAARGGYGTVFWLRGGLVEWRQAGLPVDSE